MKRVYLSISLSLFFLACKKDVTVEPVQPTPILTGKYVNIESSDTISIVFERWHQGGVTPNSLQYYIAYPVFCDTLDYSLTSSSPQSKVNLLDDCYHSNKDSIIPTISNVGVISGKLRSDTLILHIKPYTFNVFSSYKYKKI